MKAPPSFNTGDPSYLVPASTSGSASPTLLTVSKGSGGPGLFGVRFIEATVYSPSRDEEAENAEVVSRTRDEPKTQRR